MADIARFPVLTLDVSISDAYAQMKEARRSAVIIPHEEMFRIVTASELVANQMHREDPLASLAALRVAAPLGMLRGAEQFSPRAMTSTGGPALLRRRLASTGLRFVVSNVKGGRAQLISPDIALVRSWIIAPSTCYCANPAYDHKYPADRHGTKCDRDQYPIECW